MPEENELQATAPVADAPIESEKPQTVEAAPAPGPESSEIPEARTPAASPEAAPAKPAPRMFSEDDVRKLQSDKDTELSQLRQQQAQSALQQQLAQMQAQEQAAQVKDSTDVAKGILTEEQAAERAQLRQQHNQLRYRNLQLQQQAQQVSQQAEAAAYIQVAHVIAERVGEEEGLNQAEILQLGRTLLGNKERYGTPQDMENAALRLMNKRHKEALRKATTKPETYDKGPGGSAGGMSDTAFMKAFNEGDLNSPADIKRAEQILSKLY